MSLQRHLNSFFSPPKRKADPFYGKAKRLAAKLGITVTIERDLSSPSYWIEDDRLSGEQYCSSWQEVHEKLERLRD